VFCQLEMLRLCLRSRVRHFLDELPDSLDETYERILKGIHKTNRGYVQHLLQCLAMAFRPLRVEELAEILKFDVEAIEGEVPASDADSRREEQEHELLSACPSLITIVGSGGSRVVQFSHFSVKEFLTSDRLSTTSEDIVRYHIIPKAAHTTLVRASLGFLLRLDDSVLSSEAMNTPLAEYAAKYWVSHAQMGGVSSRIMGTMKALFDSDKPHFTVWTQIYNIDVPTNRLPPRNNGDPLYYSAFCGFYHLVQHLLKKHSQSINSIGGEHDYPLVAALNEGHIRVAELLFQRGAHVDARGIEEQTPLHRAIQWPKNFAVSAVQFLLKHGADVNAQRKDLLTPLHLAAIEGKFEVAQILLQHRDGADVHSRNLSRETPLHLVPQPTFADDRLNFVQLLLEHGAEVDSQNEEDATALHNASFLCLWNLEVARVLIDHGANVNALNTRRRTPLHRVAEAMDISEDHRFGVAQLLIERGAEVNARDIFHETPLHLASYFPKLNLVRMLLNHGANVNEANNRGRTPLHRVSEARGCSDEQRFSIAKLLVERGADVNARDQDDKTPLHLASHLQTEQFNLVRLFLDHGANVNAEDKQGQTPLHRVLQSKYLYPLKENFSVAQLFVERGADVNARDEYRETPLHAASYFPELKLVRMLLNHGASVNVTDRRRRTPLHRVSKGTNCSDEDRFGAAQLLLEHGADVNARNQSDKSPLHVASKFLELNLVRLLLNRGANANAEDNRGRTPLHRVLEEKDFPDKDQFGITRLLLEHGTDANTPNDDCETPLHLVASRLLSLEMAWILLKSGADVSLTNKEGKVPFQLARERMRKEMKRKLSAYSPERRGELVVLMGLLYG
jgi:ankyrin repeat protein